MIDCILHAIIEGARSRAVEEKDETRFWVTLFVGGAVIAGRVVGEDEFCDLLTGDQSARFREALAVAGPANVREGKQDIPTFIHLAGAHIILGRDRVPPEGMLWRGRLDRIDAFGVGMSQLAGHQPAAPLPVVAQPASRRRPRFGK